MARRNVGLFMDYFEGLSVHFYNLGGVAVMHFPPSHSRLFYSPSLESASQMSLIQMASSLEHMLRLFSSQ